MKEVIVITTVSLWMTLAITISDRFIFKEITKKDPFNSITEIHYEIYDIKRDVIHQIDKEEKQRISIKVDTIEKYTSYLNVGRTEPVILLFQKVNFEGFSCMKETKTYLLHDMYDISLRLHKVETITYYAKS